MLDVLGVLVVAEVAVHLCLHQEEPDGGRGELDGSGDQSDDTSNDEDTVPKPQQNKDLKCFEKGEQININIDFSTNLVIYNIE